MTEHVDYGSLTDYVTSLYVDDDEALREVYENTPREGLPAISISPEEGCFLGLLVRLGRVCRAIEIGTLGGYSGTWIARALPADGQLITLELNPHHAEVAQRHFELTGVADKVDIRIGKAQNTLTELGADGPYDMVFIDADKLGYPKYFLWAIEHVRGGGLIVAHNAFRAGRVLAADIDDPGTAAIRECNQLAADDPRVDASIFPGGDGMLVAVRSEHN